MYTCTIRIFLPCLRRNKVQLRTMCGSRTGGWSLPCVMRD
jgi:hypothetical protein